MKIVYCGFGRAGLECFYQLLSACSINIKDILVFTHDAEENDEFIKHLENNNIDYHKDSINNYIKEVNNFNPDYLISVYYRFIIKKEVLEIVNYKAMNLHPSLLPAYRGTKSSVWALLNNEEKTGISFHYINEKIDDGNILLQRNININNNDTAYSLYHKLISVFVQNFNSAFELLIDNDLGKNQVGKISYYKRELPYNGIRKFSEITYQEAEQFVKGMYYPPFKGAMFEKKDGTIVEVKFTNDLIKYESLIGK